MFELMYLGHLLRKFSTRLFGIANIKESHHLYACLGAISLLAGIIFTVGAILLIFGAVLYCFRRPVIYPEPVQRSPRAYQRFLVTGAIMLIVAAFLLAALILTEHALTTVN